MPLSTSLPLAIVICGPSGCGKSTVARHLAAVLHYRFVEGDDYHSEENCNKMSNGTSLTDADREPWLSQLRTEVIVPALHGEGVVLACSALKRRYREVLSGGMENVLFILLHCSFELLDRRMRARKGHFMPPSLLNSQLDTLEMLDVQTERGMVIEMEAATTAEQVVAHVVWKFSQKSRM